MTKRADEFSSVDLVCWLCFISLFSLADWWKLLGSACVTLLYLRAMWLLVVAFVL